MVRRKAVTLALVAALGAAAMGADSCEESAEELEDVAGENDAQYRAAMRRIEPGMTKQQVLDIVGSKPRDRQVMRGEWGTDESLYWGSYQVNLTDGQVTSVNRY